MEQCAKGNLKKLKVARLQDSMFAADSYNFSFCVSDTFFQYTVDRDKKDAALLNCSVFLWRTLVSEIFPRNLKTSLICSNTS